MKVADHTPLTPFILADGQAGPASVDTLPNYSKLPHFHLHIGPVKQVLIVATFSLPFSLLLFFFPFLSPPEGISVIGNGEFKRAVIACARHPDSNPPY